MTTVSKWRIFCTTEGNWVETWATAEPTTCPNDTAHTINIDSIQNIEQITSQDVVVRNTSQTLFQDSIVAQKTPLIDLKSFYGISSLRDTVTVSGSAQVSCVAGTDSEINVSTSTTTTSKAQIQSVQRGQYVAGTICEAGIAVRIPVALTGLQVLKFGHFDDSDGFYFKLTSTDFFCCVLNNGVELAIPRNEFNSFRLDGSESNGITLDFAKGNIFQIRFSWYGYGAVQFGIVAAGPNNVQKVFVFHQYTTSGHTSTHNPNLPLNLVLDNNGQGTSQSMYLAGRQFSILGRESTSCRSNMTYIRNKSTSSTLLPILSLRKKNPFQSCRIRITSITLSASFDSLVKLIDGPTLTGSNFVANPHATESAVENDESSTALTGGMTVFSRLIFGGETTTIDLCGYRVDLTETSPFTVAVICFGGALDVKNVSVSLEYGESW